MGNELKLERFGCTRIRKGYHFYRSLRVSGTCCIYEVERKRKRVPFLCAPCTTPFYRDFLFSNRQKETGQRQVFHPAAEMRKTCANPFRLDLSGCLGTNFNDNSRGAEVATFGIMWKWAGEEPLARRRKRGVAIPGNADFPFP